MIFTKIMSNYRKDGSVQKKRSELMRKAYLTFTKKKPCQLISVLADGNWHFKEFDIFCADFLVPTQTSRKPNL